MKKRKGKKADLFGHDSVGPGQDLFFSLFNRQRMTTTSRGRLEHGLLRYCSNHATSTSRLVGKKLADVWRSEDVTRREGGGGGEGRG